MDELFGWAVFLLILLGGLQTFFPRRHPTAIKWVSIMSSGLAGIMVGLYAFAFPTNLIAAMILALILIALSILSRWLVSLSYK